MCIFAKKKLVRVPQQNDWVVFIIIGCIFLYIIMFLSLRRDSTVREFLLQKLADSTNNFLSWGIIGLVFTLLLATLASQSVPVVPKVISDVKVFGYSLNKFGFTFLLLLVFFLIKNMLSYLLYAGTSSLKRWPAFYFAASKFFFVYSVVIMAMCVAKYFYIIEELLLFDVFFWIMAFAFVFKLFYYLLHPSNILPEKWYYKLLYICTLQIVPILVLWKVLYL